jgi:predicted nucleic acid-binding protein
MFLIDTNVWLERLLDQDRSEEVGLFLDRIPSETFFITDFSLHSLGIILTKLKQTQAFQNFIQDVLIDGSVRLIHLTTPEMEDIIRVIDRYQLDFDDSYQYVAAEIYGLTIVSFDNDFNRTGRGKKFPGEIL